MVTDIFNARMVMLFVVGIIEPLRGWVKSYKPTTLQDAVGCTRDMQDVVPKRRFPLKPTFPQKRKGTKPFQRDLAGKPKMDEETRRDLRRKKLFFIYQESWVPGHKCVGKDKTNKVHYIQVYLDSDSDFEEEKHEQEQGHQTSGEETSQARAKGPIMESMLGLPRYHTFKV
jgi:hypothetical protein